MGLREERVKLDETRDPFKDWVQDPPTLRAGRKRRVLQTTLRREGGWDSLF